MQPVRRGWCGKTRLMRYSRVHDVRLVRLTFRRVQHPRDRQLCAERIHRSLRAQLAWPWIWISFKSIRGIANDFTSTPTTRSCIRRSGFPKDGSTQRCGGSSNTWNEFVNSVSFTFAHSSSSLTLKITTNLNSAGTDESWGIQKIDMSLDLIELLLISERARICATSTPRMVGKTRMMRQSRARRAARSAQF